MTPDDIRRRRASVRQQMMRARQAMQTAQMELRRLQEVCDHPSATKGRRGDDEVIVDCPDCGYVE
jgi:hypothetical protein